MWIATATRGLRIAGRFGACNAGVVARTRLFDNVGGGAPSGSMTVSQALAQSRSSSNSPASAADSKGTSGTGFKPPNANAHINLKGLRQEVSRAILRTFKKVGKANERLQRASKEYQEIMALESPSTVQLEACPDPDAVATQLAELQATLNTLRDLEEGLKDIKSTADDAFAGLLSVATSLDVGDMPPPIPERGPKKAKGPRMLPPRKPYHTHTSVDGIEIRVGRGASDNDQLSCDFEHRDPGDWWLHVAGSPGSHVIIRSQDDQVPFKFPETLKDAAILAAVNSKAGTGRVPVTFTRARSVSKPPGAKPGLVRLSGEVGTVTIDIKLEKKRLERLRGQLEAPAPPTE